MNENEVSGKVLEIDLKLRILLNLKVVEYKPLLQYSKLELLFSFLFELRSEILSGSDSGNSQG